MQTLDVINATLATLGERGITLVGDIHPRKADILAALNRTNLYIQSKGWYYNRRRFTGTPSAVDGSLPVPNELLGIFPLKGQTWMPGRLVWRSGFIFDSWKDTFDLRSIGASISWDGIALTTFDQCPVLHRTYIGLSTVQEYQRNFDGDSSKMRILAMQVAQAEQAANADEIRVTQASMVIDNPNWQHIQVLNADGRIPG